MYDFIGDAFDLYWKDDNYELNAKKKRTLDLVFYMLNRSQEIFVWEGLPDTIPAHNLETLLQTCGNACITEVTDVPEGRGESGLYAFYGGLGGMLNAYYEPTKYVVANPYLEFNKELEIGKDCIRSRNDMYGVGLMPMFTKYGSMLNENEISMNMLAICYRIDNLISADNDRAFESAKDYLDNIVSGQFGVISSDEFFDGIRNDKTTGSSKSIKDLIEYEQYIKASWYNEIGLNSNYNMKRERIVASESEMNDDALIPLVDNMLEWRLKTIEEMKELYGDKYDLSKLTCKLNPIWDLDRIYKGMIPEEEVEEEPEEVEEELDNGEIEETETEITDDTEDELDTEEELDNQTGGDNAEEPTDDNEPEEISERLESIEETLEELVEEVTDNEES